MDLLAKKNFVDIETQGEFTYGMTSVDISGVPEKKANGEFIHHLIVTASGNCLAMH
ncbi:hypothetical protein [Lentibacillus salinarum]|uniref:Uncharacterized protein n=1 Tax=Lentibacillus salinarum TaxID=446820 RepID=A0ABW3ZP16_9BACI